MGNQPKTSKSNPLYIIAIIIIILLGIGSCNSCSSSSASNTRTCQVCHKTFTNSDDVHSIVWSNMCEKCYSNYKYTQKALDGYKKYQENQ